MHLLKKKLKYISNFFIKGVGGVKSNNDPPRHTGALLGAIPRHHYELFILVVKLSVVERRARRCLKAHIKTYLIHALHFKIKVMCKVKVRLNVTMKCFSSLGYRVD